MENLGANGSSECEGGGSVGESDRRWKLKSLAVSSLRSRFDGFEIATCELEHSLDVSNGPSVVSERQDDALLPFEDPITSRNRFFGAGAVVEVQYRHEGKDVAALTADYFRAGYGVYRAHEADFSKKQFRIERFEQAFNERWPNAFAPCFTDVDEAFHNIESVEFDPQGESQASGYWQPRTVLTKY